MFLDFTNCQVSNNPTIHEVSFFINSLYTLYYIGSFLPFYRQNPHKKNFDKAPEISPAGYIDLQNRRELFGKRGANSDRKNNLISRPGQYGGGRTTRKTDYRL